jgi:hypothetical protein
MTEKNFCVREKLRGCPDFASTMVNIKNKTVKVFHNSCNSGNRFVTDTYVRNGEENFFETRFTP